jgi:hypothetical protein
LEQVPVKIRISSHPQRCIWTPPVWVLHPESRCSCTPSLSRRRTANKWPVSEGKAVQVTAKQLELEARPGPRRSMTPSQVPVLAERVWPQTTGMDQPTSPPSTIHHCTRSTTTFSPGHRCSQGGGIIPHVLIVSRRVYRPGQALS